MSSHGMVLPKVVSPRNVVQVIAWLSFVALTVWVHHEVKFTGRHATQSGAVRELGRLKIGNPAPAFSTRDLEGHAVALGTFRGQKVVVLDFWATWCVPCRMGMPSLQALHDEFTTQNIEILAVNQGEGPAQVRSFMGKKGYTVRALLDQDETIGETFGVRAIPTMVVIDKRGLVQWIHVGSLTEPDAVKPVLKRLIAE